MLPPIADGDVTNEGGEDGDVDTKNVQETKEVRLENSVDEGLVGKKFAATVRGPEASMDARNHLTHMLEDLSEVPDPLLLELAIGSNMVSL